MVSSSANMCNFQEIQQISSIFTMENVWENKESHRKKWGSAGQVAAPDET